MRSCAPPTIISGQRMRAPREGWRFASRIAANARAPSARSAPHSASIGSAPRCRCCAVAAAVGRDLVFLERRREPSYPPRWREILALPSAPSLPPPATKRAAASGIPRFQHRRGKALLEIVRPPGQIAQRQMAAHQWPNRTGPRHPPFNWRAHHRVEVEIEIGEAPDIPLLPVGGGGCDRPRHAPVETDDAIAAPEPRR